MNKHKVTVSRRTLSTTVSPLSPDFCGQYDESRHDGGRMFNSLAEIMRKTFEQFQHLKENDNLLVIAT